MKYDTEKLAEAIRQAVAAGREFASREDEGSCNLDYSYICVEGMREKQAEKIAELSGCRVSLRNSRWHGRHLAIGGTDGQAARRTAMAEAQFQSLKSQGIRAGMSYNMD